MSFPNTIINLVDALEENMMNVHTTEPFGFAPCLSLGILDRLQHVLNREKLAIWRLVRNRATTFTPE